MELISSLTDAQRHALRWAWAKNVRARDEQLEPDGIWKTWLILAGRGFGKTRSGAEWVRAMACGSTPLGKSRAGRFAIVAETAADARDVLVEGESGILSVHPPDFRPKYEPSKRRLTWPNGATATLYNGREPDQLRGPQFDCAWVDELCKYRYPNECWDMLQFALRLGDDPRQMITTTPRPIALLKQIIADPMTVTVRGRTMDNALNLAPTFLAQIQTRYAGTRLGQQELDAKILDDAPDALWRRAQLDEDRVGMGRDGQYTRRGQPFTLPDMQRVLIAVDPAGAEGGEATEDTGAETGIMAVGLGIDGRGYVLDDLTCNLGPDGWARRAVAGFDRFQADAIVVEKNNGGAMVAQTVRSIRATLPIIEVSASRGKVTRAEPISALYTQNRISHVGSFTALEDQMCVFTPYGIIGGTTGDRVDALVWGFTQLFPAITRPIQTEPVRVIGNPLLKVGPTRPGPSPSSSRPTVITR